MPLVPDEIVVFGSPGETIEATDQTLSDAAREASGAIGPVGAAKQLADSLELLEAVRGAAAVPPEPVETLCNATHPACERRPLVRARVMYVLDGERLVVVERAGR